MATLPNIANLNQSGVATATPLAVAPVNPQGNITSVGQVGQTPTPVSQTTGNTIADTITKARQQYPNSDGAILNAFIRDNQTTHPDVVKTVQSLMSNDRASRNNNPTAMTTDVATSLGLKDGTDFTAGNNFSTSTGDLTTAQLNGDPIQTTIKAFDTAAANGTPIFQTASGKPRWSYIDMTNQQWQAKTAEQKAQVIAEMKTKGEGSTGYSPTQILDSLVRDNPSQQNGNQNGNQTGNQTTPLPTLGHELAPEFHKDYWSGLGSDLSGAVSQIGQSAQDAFKGKINPISGLVQVAGGVAGALSDVVGKAAEMVPGVKIAEDELGLGVGALAKTTAGQTVVKSMQNWATTHPELAGDMNAGFNIITAIPILNGFSVLKNVVLDSASVALRNLAEKQAVSDLSEVVSRTVGGREALQAVPDGLKTLMTNNAIPDITTEGGVSRYSTQGAYDTISKQISKIDDTELQSTLAKANVPDISQRPALADLRANALQTTQDELKDPSGVNTMFDRIQAKYGDYPTLQQINEAKRTVSKQIGEAAFSDPNMTANKLSAGLYKKG